MDDHTKNMVLGLGGSPRRGGNTDMLLGAFLAGARQAGAATQVLNISALQIAPCDDCGGCTQDGECVVKDDFQNVEDAIIAADVIVLSAPLYFAGLPAQVKCLIDRSQCQWVRKYCLHLPLRLSHSRRSRRQGILLSAAGDPHANFAGMRQTVRYFFNVYEADYSEELFASGVDAKGTIDAHTLQAVFTLGEHTCATAKK